MIPDQFLMRPVTAVCIVLAALMVGGIAGWWLRRPKAKGRRYDGGVW